MYISNDPVNIGDNNDGDDDDDGGGGEKEVLVGGGDGGDNLGVTCLGYHHTLVSILMMRW